MMIVKKAGTASKGSSQFNLSTWAMSITPTRMSAGPVAYGGMDEKIGEKNKEMKKKKETTMAAWYGNY